MTLTAAGVRREMLELTLTSTSPFGRPAPLPLVEAHQDSVVTLGSMVST
jgi:hypothetical protein